MGSSSNANAARARRLLLARAGLLERNGFYGMLLMQMGLALSDEYDTAWTDGEKIAFNPDFLDGLDDGELEFVLQHEVLHAALRHPVRGLALGDRTRYNIAADIVVNSNILESSGGNLGSIALRCEGEPSMHLAPDGKEGSLYTLEEVYEMLGSQALAPSDPSAKSRSSALGGNGGSGEGGSKSPGGWDWHVAPAGDGAWADEAEWQSRIARAAAAVGASAGLAGRGTLPAGVRRMLGELHEPVLDWRTVLAEFVQEEVCDYSFSPPDRRFPDSPFLLPDYNGADVALRDVLILVDASGSVSDDELSDVLSEIAGIVEQFDGRVSGWVSFFDAEASLPQRFDGKEELLSVEPVGGGGTSFHAALRALDLIDDAQGGEVSSIVILTDGYAPFPQETAARGIPVLWLLTTEVNPPWGRAARLGCGANRRR